MATPALTVVAHSEASSDRIQRTRHARSAARKFPQSYFYTLTDLKTDLLQLALPPARGLRRPKVTTRLILTTTTISF